FDLTVVPGPCAHGRRKNAPAPAETLTSESTRGLNDQFGPPPTRSGEQRAPSGHRQRDREGPGSGLTPGQRQVPPRRAGRHRARARPLRDYGLTSAIYYWIYFFH